MAKRAAYRARQSRAGSTFDGTYQTLGNALPDDAAILKIVNNTALDVDISTDGTTDHDFLPASGGFTIYDLRANGKGKDYSEEGLVFRGGLQFYVNGSGATTGDIYLITIGEE